MPFTTTLHRGVLPRRFVYMASAHRWAGFGLNYMYIEPEGEVLCAPARAHLPEAGTQLPPQSCQLVLAPGGRLLPLAGPMRPDARYHLGQGT